MQLPWNRGEREAAACLQRLQGVDVARDQFGLRVAPDQLSLTFQQTGRIERRDIHQQIVGDGHERGERALGQGVGTGQPQPVGLEAARPLQDGGRVLADGVTLQADDQVAARRRGHDGESVELGQIQRDGVQRQEAHAPPEHAGELGAAEPIQQRAV
ncbi:MAG: hypothetical protein ACUVSD_02675 [Thiobacillaceae bacterium]